jgi:hypothetical protein
MERREFLRVGLAGAGIGIAGCVHPENPAPTPANESVSAFLRRVDHGRHAIAQSKPLTDVLGREGCDASRVPPKELARKEELFKKTLDALYLATSFRELPPDQQIDPRVQMLMWSSMGVMNDAVFGVADHLERLTKEERKAISDKLRDEPDLALRVFEAVDDEARAIDLDPQRRLQLRSIATQVGWRLRMQPAALFVDEHVAKVRTLAERQNRELLKAIETAPPPQGAENASPKRGGVVITIGALLLGLSIVVGAAGAVIVAAGSLVGAFVLTAGVLGAVGGLVTLIVGLIIYASS